MITSESKISLGRFIANSMIGIGLFNTVIFGTFTLSVMIHPELSFVYRILGCLMTGSGVALIVFGRTRILLINEFRRYQLLLSTDPSGSIASLAAAVNSSNDEVMKKLKLMIKRKFFKNAYIDYEIGCILQRSKRTPEKMREEKLNFISVTCASCGGSNKIISGKIGECEYCGSPLNGKMK